MLEGNCPSPLEFFLGGISTERLYYSIAGLHNLCGKVVFSYSTQSHKRYRIVQTGSEPMLGQIILFPFWESNNNNNKQLYSACSTECTHRRFAVNYYYFPWFIGLETTIYRHSPAVEHTSPAAYVALVELFNHTVSFTARPGSTRW